MGDDGTLRASVDVDGGYYTKAPTTCRSSGRSPAHRRVRTSARGSPATASWRPTPRGTCSRVTSRARRCRAYADAFLPERWAREAYCRSVASGEAAKGLQI